MFGSIFRYVQGIVRLIGGTDGTVIGNDGDALKVYVEGYDSTSRATIDFAHYMVHRGHSFSHEMVVTLGNGATYDHVFTPPATGTRSPHFTYNFEAAGETEFEIFKNPTLVAGSAMQIVNRHLGSSTTPTCTLTGVTSVTSTGTRFCHEKTGMGGGSSGKFGASSEVDEYIFKVGDSYLIRFTSHVPGNEISLRFLWYEYDYLSVTGV